MEVVIGERLPNLGKVNCMPEQRFRAGSLNSLRKSIIRRPAQRPVENGQQPCNEKHETQKA